jgi:hypothetical protein
MQLGRIVLLSAAFAAIVTFYSLRELHSLTAEQEAEVADSSSLPAHHDWRMIAERAVQHVEHFPRHPFRSTGEDSTGSGKLGA